MKFHARGAGGGSGPADYLLGRDRERDGATLLRGDPQQTIDLIDSSDFSRRYTSGVLSFAERDLPDATKAQLMDSFERALLPGLEADQYDCMWVEHRDKDRLELNFVIPNVELTTGKRLQPYYDRVDRPRIDAWQTLVNAEHDLHDPNDPANRRAMAYAGDLPRDKQQAVKAITDGLLALAERGEVTNRTEVVRALESAGFEVTRQTKSSISIADIADSDGGRPLRLKGAIYERDFTLGAGLREQLEERSEAYRGEREQRLQRARESVEAGIERRGEANQRRYPRPEPTSAPDRTQGVAMDAAQPGDDRLSERRDARLDGHTNQLERRGDTTAAIDARAADEPRRGRTDDEMRRQSSSVHRDGSEHESVFNRRQRSLHDPRGVLTDGDDPARRTASERVRALVSRIQSLANSVVEGCQRAASTMRGDGIRADAVGRAGDDLERASRRLVNASEQIERASRSVERRLNARQSQDRKHEPENRSPKNPGPSMGM